MPTDTPKRAGAETVRDWIERWNRTSKRLTTALVLALLAFMLWKALYP